MILCLMDSELSLLRSSARIVTLFSELLSLGKAISVFSFSSTARRPGEKLIFKIPEDEQVRIGILCSKGIQLPLNQLRNSK